MPKDLKIKAGTIGLILACIGTIGRMIFVATRPGGLHPIDVVANLSSSQMALGSISAFLVLIGGLLAAFGAIKNDGRETGCVGLGLAVIVFILMFTKGVI